MYYTEQSKIEHDMENLIFTKAGNKSKWCYKLWPILYLNKRKEDTKIITPILERGTQVQQNEGTGSAGM